MKEIFSARKCKVLYIDDDKALCTLVKKFLGDDSYELKISHSGEEGLETAMQFVPDIIVSDLVMPKMSGVELCKKLREIPYLTTSIILLTSSIKTDVQDAVKAIETGADDYIIKPFSKDELLAKLKAFRRIKELQDNLVETNNKLEKNIRSLEEYKKELEEKNNELEHDKEILEHSFKQVSLMSKELEKTNKRLEQAISLHERDFNNLISLLSSLIESRRQYHRGHARKVAEISTYIAEKMGLESKQIREIGIAAQLHEIGKYGIPDELAMKKPTEYTPEEKDMLSQHPIIGYSLLKDFTGFENISLIIKHQHEWMDGSGYPDRLKGEDIPLGSRIIAVASLFDNIVYRSKEGTVEMAFTNIDEQIGSRFDPMVVHNLRKFVEEYQPDQSEKCKEVSIFELEEGMILAHDLYTRSGIKLMPRDTSLTKATIAKIIKYNKIDPLEETVFVKD